MSIQIQPQKNFAIVRQLPDPSDATTYYTQSEIRNAETDALITRVNLTDKGSRRFVGVWRAIADASGQGTLVSIRTTVYTDSGYTTKSTTYGEEMETYLVMERFNPRAIVSLLGPSLFSGGDSPDINYKKIREIFKDVLAANLPPLTKAIAGIEMPKIPEAKDYAKDFSELKSAISSSEKSVIAAMPEFERADFGPIATMIAEKFTEVRDLLDTLKYEMPKTPEPVDLSPVTAAIDRLESEAYDKIKVLFEENLPEMFREIGDLKTLLHDAFLYQMALGGRTNTQKATPEVNPHQVRAAEILGLPVK